MSVSALTFRNLTKLNLAEIREEAKSESGRREMIEALNEYFSDSSPAHGKDAEKAYFLGYDLGGVWPFDELGELAALKALSRQKDIGEAFVGGLNHAVETTAIGSADSVAPARGRLVAARQADDNIVRAAARIVIIGLLASTKAVWRFLDRRSG